jgi:hypothetical protein
MRMRLPGFSLSSSPEDISLETADTEKIVSKTADSIDLIKQAQSPDFNAVCPHLSHIDNPRGCSPPIPGYILIL